MLSAHRDFFDESKTKKILNIKLDFFSLTINES